MSDRHPSEDPRAAGANIDRTLAAQLARIRARFLAHGAGWLTAAVFGAGVAYYVLDRNLHLPGAVRVIATLACVAGAVLAFRRRIAYPMSRRFGHDDVAIAVERRFPELREKLITAVQLKSTLAAAPTDAHALRGESVAMIRRVVADAAQDVDRVRLGELFDTGHTLRVWAVAAAGIAVAGFAALGDPAGTRVFLQRALGFATPYPRLTSLFVELPEDGEDYRIEYGDDTARVTLAAGAELPILVRVEGDEPRDVALVIQGGRGMPPEVAMSKRAPGRFRHVFRRVKDDFSFHARGGDDPHGDLLVTIHTVHPPLVGTIQAELDYPDYTGLPDAIATGGSIEALVGTQVRLRVVTTAPVTRATMLLVDSGARVDLQPSSIQDDSGLGHAFATEFRVEATDRYQIELLSPHGLRNPSPGTYPIIAQPDHEPVGKLLQPPSDDILVVVPGALVPVRIAASDDYGLAVIEANAQTGRSGAEQRVAILPASPAGQAPLRAVCSTEIVDLTAFEGGGPQVGDSVSLTAVLVDNRVPEPSRIELMSRQLHVVDTADLARRVSGHFRRVRDEVEKALDLQTERQAQLVDVIEEFATLERGPARRGRLVAVEVGQTRVLASCDRVLRDLMRAFDVHLFNRLEDSIHAAGVLELYRSYHRANGDAEPYLPGFYRLVAAERVAGRIGALERALDPILDMTGRTDRIVHTLAPRTIENLAAAAVAASDDDARVALRATVDLQEQIAVELRALQSRLQEWSEFQDVVQQTRALRDQQKDIENRTRSLQGGNK